MEVCDLVFQLGYLILEAFVFLNFAAQKFNRQLHPFINSPGRQGIGIGGLVPAVLEALDSDMAFFDEAGQAIVGLAQADAQMFGHFALGDLVVGGFQDLQDPHPGFVFGIVHVVNLMSQGGGGCQGKCMGKVIKEGQRAEGQGQRDKGRGTRC